MLRTRLEICQEHKLNGLPALTLGGRREKRPLIGTSSEWQPL